MTHEERMERLEEMKQVRLEHCRERAGHLLYLESHTDDWEKKKQYINIANMYIHMIMVIKYGREYEE